jgi:hypothetical protein
MSGDSISSAQGCCEPSTDRGDQFIGGVVSVSAIYPRQIVEADDQNRERGTFAAVWPQRWSTISLKARREQNVPSTNETGGQSASGCGLGARDSTRNTPWTRHGRPAPSANQRPKSSTS